MHACSLHNINQIKEIEIISDSDITTNMVATRSLSNTLHKFAIPRAGNLRVRKHDGA